MFTYNNPFEQQAASYFFLVILDFVGGGGGVTSLTPMGMYDLLLTTGIEWISNFQPTVFPHTRIIEMFTVYVPEIFVRFNSFDKVFFKFSTCWVYVSHLNWSRFKYSIRVTYLQTYNRWVKHSLAVEMMSMVRCLVVPNNNCLI